MGAGLYSFIHYRVREASDCDCMVYNITAD